MARTFCERSTRTQRFAAALSDSNRNPATPLRMTSCGVARSVRPMKPTRTPSNSLMSYAGSTDPDL
jgi:hypothetical protein